MEDFDAFVAAAWDAHADDPQAVADRLAAALPGVSVVPVQLRSARWPSAEKIGRRRWKESPGAARRG